MKPGNAFTIEPMISEGVWTDQTWPDNWTAVTTDGKLSAQVCNKFLYFLPSLCIHSKNQLQIYRLSFQFEQTMVVTDKGVEVLTARPGGKANVPHFMDQLEAFK